MKNKLTVTEQGRGTSLVPGDVVTLVENKTVKVTDDKGYIHNILPRYLELYVEPSVVLDIDPEIKNAVDNEVTDLKTEGYEEEDDDEVV